MLCLTLTMRNSGHDGIHSALTISSTLATVIVYSSGKLMEEEKEG